MTCTHPCPWPLEHPARHAWDVWAELIRMRLPHGPEPTERPANARGRGEGGQCGPGPTRIKGGSARPSRTRRHREEED